MTMEAIDLLPLSQEEEGDYSDRVRKELVLIEKIAPYGGVYTPSKKCVTQVVRREGIQLNNILAELGISVLNPLQVKAYQKKKLAEWKAWDERCEKIANWWWCVSICSLLLFCFCLVAFLSSELNSLPPILFLAGTLCSFTLLIFSSRRMISVFRKKVNIKHWEKETFESYGQEDVPTNAIALTRKIQARLPKVRVMVEYPKDQPDPFLFVTYGDQGHYVAVWDEEGFHGTRIV